ncbi:MAG: NAD(P)-dependent alcohol dehydrogenase [Devosia sp.]|nr:NAD(P)-dependent alcohol dehydrogenase [Devosia sp.]
MDITAAVARGIGQPFSIEPVQIEEPRDDEVLVRLVATGICHTDMSMRDHKIYPVPHPVVLGHEGAGIIERVGKAVTKVVPGDHVILVSGACGHCPSCEAGLPVYCYHFNEHNFYGSRADGTSPLSQHGEMMHYFQAQSSFATFSIARERNVVRVPKDAPLEMLGPFGCGVMTGAGAIINSMPVDVGDSVAVFGTGAVGLSAIMAAKLVGAATIVAVDMLDSRLDLARELGATDTINPQNEDMAAALKRITGGVGLNYALDTTANMGVLRQAIDALAPRGTCGFVGGAPPGMELTIDVEHVMVGGRTIRGIIQGDSNADVFLPKLVELFVKGRFPIDKLIRFYPFVEINNAVADALSGKVVKPVLRF